MAAVADTAASCVPRAGADAAPRDFFRVNAFVTLPTMTASSTLNAYSYVQERATTCAGIAGQDVSFYSVDFWHVGQVPEWVQDTNRAKAEANSNE